MDTRIIFMGTSYFSILSIEKILKYKYNVIGVVTITDRFSVRNKRIFVESVIKKYARLHALPILQSDDLKYPLFLEILKRWHTEIIVTAAFRILPKIVWEGVSFGSFNLHPSILPNYKGACPIQWVIINGENDTGVTTFKVSEKIDMGRILLQKRISIERKENAGCLSIRLSEIGASLVADTIKIFNFLATKKQPTTFQLNLAPKLLKFYSKINWKRTIKDIYNNIRGNSPFPGAWCIIANNIYKIYRVDYRIEGHSYNIGNIEINKIAINEGYLSILEYQLEGNHPLMIKDHIDKKLRHSQNSEIQRS